MGQFVRRLSKTVKGGFKQGATWWVKTNRATVKLGTAVGTELLSHTVGETAAGAVGRGVNGVWDKVHNAEQRALNRL